MFICVFFNDTATTEIYTLSLHDALPISGYTNRPMRVRSKRNRFGRAAVSLSAGTTQRSEEHTSELQSRQYLVCRLLLEKKKQQKLAIAYPVTLLRHKSRIPLATSTTNND